MIMATPLLEVSDYRLGIDVAGDVARILDGVNLSVRRGEIIGLAGESGCGKSTLVKSILGVAPTGARALGGGIRFDGEELIGLSDAEMSSRIRSRKIGFVPQDPFQSFNPLFTVGYQILDLMRWRAPDSAGRTPAARKDRLIGLLDQMRLPDPTAILARYPHQLSGGQLQRLMIASAMACEPQLILADEPTSALDVTTQGQIMGILERIGRESGVAVLMVTHDLGLVAQFCDRVTVIYAGQSVEDLPAREALGEARHPYTRMLIDCHPDRGGALRGIPGVVPAIDRMPEGCRFLPRCPNATTQCATRPPNRAIAEEHRIQCWSPTPEEHRIDIG